MSRLSVKAKSPKKQIAINPDAENVIKGTTIEGFQIETSDIDTTNELLIKMALSKREQLKKFYEQADSDVNPLLLIQIPDRRYSPNITISSNQTITSGCSSRQWTVM